jgi:hypothetical protein
MTCRYHQGKDPRCAECAVARVWEVYYDWHDMIHFDEQILKDIKNALEGPQGKSKTKKNVKKKKETYTNESEQYE